jgi:hypothetical protein
LVIIIRLNGKEMGRITEYGGQTYLTGRAIDLLSRLSNFAPVPILPGYKGLVPFALSEGMTVIPGLGNVTFQKLP